jgi:hypothetical protein
MMMGASLRQPIRYEHARLPDGSLKLAGRDETPNFFLTTEAADRTPQRAIG